VTQRKKETQQNSEDRTPRRGLRLTPALVWRGLRENGSGDKGIRFVLLDYHGGIDDISMRALRCPVSRSATLERESHCQYPFTSLPSPTFDFPCLPPLLLPTLQAPIPLRFFPQIGLGAGDKDARGRGPCGPSGLPSRILCRRLRACYRAGAAPGALVGHAAERRSGAAPPRVAVRGNVQILSRRHLLALHSLRAAARIPSLGLEDGGVDAMARRILMPK